MANRNSLKSNQKGLKMMHKMREIRRFLNLSIFVIANARILVCNSSIGNKAWGKNDCSGAKTANLGLPIFLLRTIIWLSVMCIFLTTINTVKGRDKPDVRCILELARGDSVTINFETVIKECSNAIADKEKLSQSFLSEIYMRRAIAYGELGKFKEAKKDFERVLEIKPRDPEAISKRAFVLIGMRLEDRATDEFKSLTYSQPRYAPAYMGLGFIMAVHEKWSACTKYETDAIRIDKDLGRAYFIRAFAYYMQNDYAHCLEDITHYINLMPCPSPSEADAPYVLRGKALLHLGRVHEALPNFLLARRLAPSSYKATYGVWCVYWQTRKYHLCRVLSDELLGLDPKESISFNARAASLSALGQLQDGLVAARKALELRPKERNSYCQIGAIYAAMGKFEMALKSYDKALEIDANSKEAMVAKTFILSTCPDPKYRDARAARKLADKLCKLTKNKDPRVLLTAGVAYAACGEFREALRLVNKALELPDVRPEVRAEGEMLRSLFKQCKPARYKPEPRYFGFAAWRTRKLALLYPLTVDPHAKANPHQIKKPGMVEQKSRALAATGSFFAGSWSGYNPAQGVLQNTQDRRSQKATGP